MTDPWSWRRLHTVSAQEARRVLGPCPLAEDAAQDALVRAWTHRHACRTPERPEPWMRAIARREALRLSSRASPVPAGAVPEEAPAPAAEPSLLRLQVQAALDELPLDDRRLIVGRYWHDLRDRELASLLGVEETTVRVRLHRIRRRLRQNLIDE
jgi:RNA polymerase sigma-70 factor, ECF subfamily